MADDSPRPQNGVDTIWTTGSGAMVSDDIIHPHMVNSAMQQTLAQANEEKRLITGFKLVQDYVENRSESVLFCVLPENLWNDKLRKAMFKLLVSNCYQNGVKMIKVDHDQLVQKIIERTCSQPQAADLSYECMAVLCRDGQPLSCEAELLRYHKMFPGHDFDQLPLVNLLES